MASKAKRYWTGDGPEICGICDEPLKEEFVDGRTRKGRSWELICPTCHTKFGVGLGEGCGQRYTLQADKRWLKTGG